MYANYWVVEYSVQQQCYHCETLGNAIRINAGLVKRKDENGYVIIGGLFETMDEALEYLNLFQKEHKLPVKDIFG